MADEGEGPENGARVAGQDGGDPHGDRSMLQSFGYDQQLSRSLSFWTMFGLSFSYTSPTVGAYTLFAFGLSTGGGLFLWGMPIVVVGQLLVALIFAELAVIYPMAGALYQWARRLVGPRYGWLVGTLTSAVGPQVAFDHLGPPGWAYCWALLITIAAVDLGAAPYFLETLGVLPFGSGGGETGVEKESYGEVGIALAVCVLQTLINIGGVRITTLLTNVGMVLEFVMTLGVAAFLLLSSGPHQPYSSVFESSSTYSGHFPFLAAILAQAFIFYGFESAAALSEEVQDSRKAVPRTMIMSLVSAGFAVFLLQFALITSRPDLETTSISAILQAHMGFYLTWIVSVLLLVCYISCAGAMQAAIARIIWAYARDDVLPFSPWLKKVSGATKVPVNATLVTAVIPMLVMLTTLIQIGNLNVHQIVVDYCIAGVYISFQTVVAAHIYASWTGRLDKHARLTRETTHHSDYFFLEKFRLPVGIGALVYGLAMITNILWPRPMNEFGGWITLIMTVLVLLIGITVARRRDQEVTALSASYHFDERSYLLAASHESENKEAQSLRATLRQPLTFSRPLESQLSHHE